MEGEFDREIYDDGWGPNEAFPSIREQLVALGKTVRKVHEEKEAKRLMTGMASHVSKKWTESEQEQKTSLGKWFKNKAEEAKKEEESYAQELETATWIKKNKLKDKCKNASQKGKYWEQWFMWWSGAKPDMIKTPNEKSEQPPPYSTGGLYPVLEVSKGVLRVDGVEMSGERRSSSVTHVRPTAPLSNTDGEEHLTDPFADRKSREHSSKGRAEISKYRNRGM